MAISATFNPSTCSVGFAKFSHHRSSFASPSSLGRIAASKTSISTSPLKWQAKQRRNTVIVLFSGGGGSSSGNGGKYSGGGGGGGGDEGEEAGDKNKGEAILALAEVGRSLDSIPSDLASAIENGRIPGSIVHRYFELEKSPLFRWLLQFGGFKERLLADDLFLAKVFMECGVGIFTKTAAEWERRRENFVKELDFVLADVVKLFALSSGAE
ncbi:protein RETICULATA-RELATED 4, chloroplastic-like [Macadamia integrifolia]|uniref:protein RETICULATA-RELATED 4, chloroplastic-like n=1 Tax=Macadamia integrifolia TaxID=60698 RepID=UPI001C4E34AA|nr:protein RETICULATA-RELATED 4, chloroplastic-like [Macadamia integrifolia]